MRLSDYQKTTPSRRTAVDALMAASAAKIRNGAVDWRNTKVVAGEGYQEGPLFHLEQAFAAGDRRTRMHRTLDQVLNDVEINLEDDEPEEEDDDAEPQEASDSWLASVEKQLRSIFHTAVDAKQSVQKKLATRRSYACDRGALTLQDYLRMERMARAQVI